MEKRACSGSPSGEVTDTGHPRAFLAVTAFLLALSCFSLGGWMVWVVSLPRPANGPHDPLLLATWPLACVSSTAVFWSIDPGQDASAGRDWEVLRGAAVFIGYLAGAVTVAGLL